MWRLRSRRTGFRGSSTGFKSHLPTCSFFFFYLTGCIGEYLANGSRRFPVSWRPSPRGRLSARTWPTSSSRSGRSYGPGHFCGYFRNRNNRRNRVATGYWESHEFLVFDG